MKKLMVLMMVLLMVLAGCSTFGTPKPQLLTDYYMTHENKTTKMELEEDIPYIIEMSKTEPLTTKIDRLWFDMDDNLLAMSVDDTLNGPGCDQAAIFQFVDVQPTMMEDWIDAQMIRGDAWSCDEFDERLADQLERTASGEFDKIE